MEGMGRGAWVDLSLPKCICNACCLVGIAITQGHHRLRAYFPSHSMRVFALPVAAHDGTHLDSHTLGGLTEWEVALQCPVRGVCASRAVGYVRKGWVWAPKQNPMSAAEIEDL